MGLTGSKREFEQRAAMLAGRGADTKVSTIPSSNCFIYPTPVLMAPVSGIGLNPPNVAHNRELGKEDQNTDGAHIARRARRWPSRHRTESAVLDRRGPKSSELIGRRKESRLAVCSESGLLIQLTEAH